MGVVYEAIDLRDNHKVALKLLASSVSEDLPDVVARFEREVQAASSINSENIVRVFDAGNEDGSPFMVMELVQGRDMHHWCKNLRQMRPEAVIRIAGQVCSGLAKAHAAGVIHRDIKPGNIFLAESDEHVTAKLLDFGIAKLKMEQVQGDPGLTKTGNMLGSPHYMSPEQAQGLKSIDQRTDIWSLGVVMYKALTGRTPFADLDSMGQVIIAIWSMPIPPVQDAAPWVSPELAAIIHKALQKKPQDRYSTADELYEDLKRLPRDNNFQIQLSHLEPLSEQARGVVAPRLAEAGPEPTDVPRLIGEEPSSGTMQAVENTHPGEMTIASARKRAGISLWIGGTLAMGAAVAVVVGAVQVGRGRNEPLASSTFASPPPPTASEAPKVEPKPAEIRGKVTVPTNAVIKIDGEVVAAVDGAIELAGPPGSIKSVVLKIGNRETTHPIILTEQGPSPATLVVEPAVKPGGKAGGKGAPATAATKDKPEATTKPVSTVDRKFE